MYDTIIERSTTLVAAERAAIDCIGNVIRTPEYSALVSFLYQSSIGGARLVITGVGKNANIATKISETMASLGVPSFYLNTSHVSHGDYGFLAIKDIVIHISRSGTTQEMLDVCKYLNDSKLVTAQVLIHCNPEIPRNPNVTMEICTGKVKEGDKHSLAPTSSTTALLCLLDAIAVTISDLRGFERFDFLKLHPCGALGAQLRKEQQNAKI